MNSMQQVYDFFCEHQALVIIAIIWDMILKMLALWKSAQRKQLGWFICLAVINTIGILPLIYLFVDPKKE